MVMNKNQFYNQSMFMLIKVRFSEADGKLYTYAAHIRHCIQPGDWVLVPTGNNEDVFNAHGGYRQLQAAEVSSITKNMDYLPDDYEIKHVIGKIKGGRTYTNLYQAKQHFKA